MSVQYYNSEYKNLSDKQYSKEKFRLQVELLKLQEWVVDNNKKVAIIFEGRDAAGKGSTIKRFIEHLMPKHLNVFELGLPTKEENKSWFKTHEKGLPKKGEIVFFDRSWYSRAMIQPTMEYCSDSQYKYFIKNVNKWEEKLINKDVIIIKFYLSVNKSTQQIRFDLREKHKLKYWKLSENDLRTLKKWKEYTFYKKKMFNKTSTKLSPWIIINSNNKMIARLNAMRYVLNKIPYTGKSELKNVSWLIDLNKKEIKLFGVKFKNLNTNQYEILNKLKQIESNKKIEL
jgi:polyphosphate kinase 2